MSYYLLSSLQRMAAVKIVTILWNRADIIALIAECTDFELSRSFGKECWQGIEGKVIESVSLLPLAASLRAKILSIVLPIGEQIYKWMETHIENFDFQKTPEAFCWTSQGTVEYKKMAEAFVHDLNLPESERYKMACFYCIEWDSPVSFRPVSKLRPREAYLAYWTYNVTGDESVLDEVIEREAEMYWIRNLYDGSVTVVRNDAVGRDTSKTPCQSAFEWAVKHRNPVAAEYYLNKLSPEERKESISRLIEFSRNFSDFEMYRIFLFHSDPTQRRKLLELRPYDLQMTLLMWPWQDFFLDVAHLLRNILHGSEFYMLLSSIVDRMANGYRDYSYRTLFRRFWVQIPVIHKKDILRDCRNSHDESCSSSSNTICRKLAEHEKKCVESSFTVCRKLAEHEEWDLLQFFIGECIVSSTSKNMIRFKEESVKRHFNDAFFQFVDELIEKCTE